MKWIYVFFQTVDFRTINKLQLQIAGALFLLIFMGICSYIGYKLAEEKGLSIKKWIFLSFIFNIWAILYLALRYKNIKA